MTCVLCSASSGAATLVRVLDRTVVGRVCLSCQQRLTAELTGGSHATCNHCEREAEYALQPEDDPLVGAGPAGTNGTILTTEQFGVFCEDHFDPHER